MQKVLTILYTDRRHAGRALAQKLKRYSNRHDVQILALPRGGVPVAFEIAQELNVPLDVFHRAQIRHTRTERTGNGRHCIGGCASSITKLFIRLGFKTTPSSRWREKEGEELLRREREFRGNAPALNLKGKWLSLVDDGFSEPGFHAEPLSWPSNRCTRKRLS